MKHAKTLAALLVMATATMGASAEKYRVTIPLGADNADETVYINNYETGTPLDSAVTNAEGIALFEGQIDEPVLARVMIGPSRGPVMVLEPGSIALSQDDGMFFGSQSNDIMRDFRRRMRDIETQYQAAATDEARDSIYGSYIAMCKTSMLDNADSPLGVFFFSNWQQDATPQEVITVTEQNPALARSPYVAKIRRAVDSKMETSVGRPYKDFEVVYDGRTEKLSDYVARGKYVLVDFWASWCGPCVRQIPVLKELQKELGPDGLEILGVAVWDRPEDTLRAIKSHGITWPCIIDAQTIPTDLYGISGIPCIILFGPDGIILSRDQQGDALKAEVRAAMGK